MKRRALFALICAFGALSVLTAAQGERTPDAAVRPQPALA